MICYLDKTFCSAKCMTVECHRNWTDDKMQAARKCWGEGHPPIAFSDFSTNCPEYQPGVAQ